MGAWGTAIFSDDVAADIRSEWRDHLGDGLSPEEATVRILTDYSHHLEDSEDRPVVWLALAVSQWKTGRLQPAIRDAARAVISSGEDLQRWDRPSDRRAREAVLSKTKEMLEGPQPAAKRIPRRVRSQTPFVPGDLFSYRHSSGRHVAFWVSENWEDHGGVYTLIDLLDFVGETVPPIEILITLPSMMRHWAPKPDGTTNPPERAGFLLLHAGRVPPSLYQVLGNVPRPDNRPEHRRVAVDATKLDQKLEDYLPPLR